MTGIQQKTDWKNLFKINLANCDDSFQKHEIVKLIIVMKLKKKYSKQNIRIYTEWIVDEKEKLICDVFFENIKTKECYAYEIQKNYSENWVKGRDKLYNEIEVPYFAFDWIPIKLKDCPNDINEINTWLDKYIC
ncbi:MAG: hypothetical protein WC758_08190 [Candidatus Woesearchaeota archaeon]|jgi:hypothetical protein